MALSPEYEGSKIWPGTIVWNWFKYVRFGASEAKYGRTLREWMKYHKIKVPYCLIRFFVNLQWKIFYREYMSEMICFLPSVMENMPYIIKQHKGKLERGCGRN